MERQPGYSFIVDAAKTITAVWENEYTVTYYPNGGTPDVDYVYKILQGNYNLIANPYTSPEGYHFLAWEVGGTDYDPNDLLTITSDIGIDAKWEINTYTVTYVDEDGNVIGAPQNITHGSNAVPEPFPDKPGYTGHWKNDGKNVTSNLTIEPEYTVILDTPYSPTYFVVKYVREDGVQIGSIQIVPQGFNTVPEAIPEKVGYLGEWDHDGKNINSHMVIRPVYVRNAYTVTYQDAYGNVFGNPQTVQHGEDAIPESLPLRIGYSAQWSHNGKDIVSDMIITPQYHILKFKVTYLDEQGETIGSPQIIDYGKNAVPETLPDKEGYLGHWSHNGRNITANMEIRPIYEKEYVETTSPPSANPVYYRVTYQDENGEIVGSVQTVRRGRNAVPEVVPHKEGYVGEWDHDGQSIMQDTIIKPVYTLMTIEVVFRDAKGNIIEILTFEYGTKIDFLTFPPVPVKPGYTGVWNYEGDNITDDTALTPVYTRIEQQPPGSGQTSRDYEKYHLGLLLVLLAVLIIIYNEISIIKEREELKTRSGAA